MMLKLLLLSISICLIFLITGCTTTEDAVNDSSEDRYELVKEAAWEFVEEKGWSQSAKGNWQNAKVEIIITDQSYELFDTQYEGKEVASVSFQDKDNVVVGTPLILVDLDSHEVVGYMPSE
jgi:putative lipoic acid-binding regulatory protein